MTLWGAGADAQESDKRRQVIKQQEREMARSKSDSQLPTDPAVPDTYIPTDANLHNTPVNNSDSLTSVPDELREAVYFYGDLCAQFQSFTTIKTVEERNRKIRAKGDELLALFTQYARQARLDELEQLSREDATTHETPIYGVTNRQIHNRIAQLTATPHEEKTNG